MLKLIMAVSADGYLASGPDDDMSWTLPEDKKVFRLLTSIGGVCGAGMRTFEMLPELKGRELVALTPDPRAPFVLKAPVPLVAPYPITNPGVMLQESFSYTRHAMMSLDAFAKHHPGAWLLGGPATAASALHRGLLSQVYMCQSPISIGSGIRDTITPQLEDAGSSWHREHAINFSNGATVVHCWRNKNARAR